MAGQRETNTMSEVCQKMLSEITKAKVMPDADLPFLIKVETDLLSYLRAPTPNTTPTGAAMPPGMPGGGGGPMTMGPPQGTPASPLAAPMPPPDELRRMLG